MQRMAFVVFRYALALIVWGLGRGTMGWLATKLINLVCAWLEQLAGPPVLRWLTKTPVQLAA